ncbi:hypothetical protein [Curtobacterium sp. 24E2]|nr:hypothetical protein JN350_14985 [Curtobacterium sp. 24E2]
MTTTLRRSGTLRAAAAAVLVGLATTSLAWWRLGPVTRGTAWAEDGGVFLRERLALGPVDSLLHPYAGYLHLVPRLLVDAAWALPVEEYARALSAAACLVVGAVALTVFLLARDVVPQWPLRALLAAVPALLPLAPHEISGNVANLHWFLLFACPWLFAHRARSWWASGVVAVLTGFVVLTELQTVLFLPMLLLAWFPLRDASGVRAWPRAVPVTLVALAGGAAQIVTAVTDQRSRAPEATGFADVVAGWLLQPVAGIWSPDVGAVVRVVVTHGWGVVLVPVLLVAAALVAAVVVGSWRARWTVLVLAVASGGVWWAALVANAGEVQAWAHPTQGLAAVPPLRYAAASGLLLLAAAVVAASVLLGPGRGATDGAGDGARPAHGGPRSGGPARSARALAGWCVVAVVVVATLGNVAPGPTRRSDGPVWATQVPAAIEACAGDPTRSVAIRKVPWSAQVPCARLLEH